MEFDFLKPISAEILGFVNTLKPQSLGSVMVFHTETDFPDLEQIQIAIVGVLENRGFSKGDKAVDLQFIRKEFYTLYPGNWHVNIADLGDIEAGAELSDTYFAVKEVVAALVKKKIIPIILGGSQDITYGMYRAYDYLEQFVNLVSIDARFDLGKEQDDAATSYISKIIIDEPNNLFNYSVLGFQTYYNAQEEIDLMDKLFFEGYRLGELTHNITLAEPVLRDADIVSVDLTAVQSAVSGNLLTFTPNGFNGKEICSLARYAGISDKVTTFGVFNQHNTPSEAVLIAQVIWYFIEGYHHRSHEYPFSSKANYFKYIVPLEQQELIFYKSDKSNRWWIEVEQIIDAHNKLQKQTLLSCTYEDYLGAINQEIPERWWKFQRKNIV